MARPELTDEQWKDLTSSIRKNNLVTYQLNDFDDADFTEKDVIIFSLQNINGDKKYVEPKNSQLAKNVRYYWENGLKDMLSCGSIQVDLQISEEYKELMLNEEFFLVNTSLL